MHLHPSTKVQKKGEIGRQEMQVPVKLRGANYNANCLWDPPKRAAYAKGKGLRFFLLAWLEVYHS